MTHTAWCRLDDRGEVVPIGKYHEADGLVIATLDRDSLDFYLYLAKAVLVQVFELSRVLKPAIPSPLVSENYIKDTLNEIYAKKSVYKSADKPNGMSFFRGFQIIRYRKTDDEMSRIVRGLEPKNYTTFIINDFKNQQIVEWSCSPDMLGNYFQQNDLPFTTSPAFFKADVLDRYKQNPTRYRISSTHIYCNGAWSIPYDVNEENQVFVYIYKLSYLPYEEQLYWKAFNENPKADISERAYRADFLGEWFHSDDPLLSLKALLEKFPVADDAGNKCLIWSMPNLPETRDIEFLNYPISDSRKTWEDQILVLSQILVEGLNKKEIQKIAKLLNCNDASLGSLKLLEKVLECVGLEASIKELIISPLGELWHIRSSKIAHSGSNIDVSNFPEHFRKLVNRCDISMSNLASLIKNGVFHISSG